MNFGGPVWHCSVAQKTDFPLMRRETLAREMLDGIGDAALGEWTEDAPKAFHLRRRLSPAEATGIGAVIDIRGTVEARQRIDALLRCVPEGFEKFATEEAGL